MKITQRTPIQMKIDNLKPLHNQIFFRFNESIIRNDKGQKMFETETEAGITVMANIEDSTKAPKWGEVLKIGDCVTDVKVGDEILIEALMWTNGIKMKNEDTFWKTDEDKIIGIRKKLS